MIKNMEEIRDECFLLEDPGCDCVVCAEVIFLLRFSSLCALQLKRIHYCISTCISSYMHVCCVKVMYTPKKFI